jgi:hypothetical protein
VNEFPELFGCAPQRLGVPCPTIGNGICPRAAGNTLHEHQHDDGLEGG